MEQDGQIERPDGSAGRIFISYASPDHDTAKAVYAELERAGFDAWMASEVLRPGQDWSAEIPKAIRASDAFVLVFTDAVKDSIFVPKEVERASSREVPIVKFRLVDEELPDSIELHLSGAHWLDAVGGPTPRDLARLVASVRMVLAGNDAPPEPLPQPFDRWAADSMLRSALFGLPVIALVAWLFAFSELALWVPGSLSPLPELVVAALALLCFHLSLSSVRTARAAGERSHDRMRAALLRRGVAAFAVGGLFTAAVGTLLDETVVHAGFTQEELYGIVTVPLPEDQEEDFDPARDYRADATPAWCVPGWSGDEAGDRILLPLGFPSTEESRSYYANPRHNRWKTDDPNRVRATAMEYPAVLDDQLEAEGSAWSWTRSVFVVLGALITCAAATVYGAAIAYAGIPRVR